MIERVLARGLLYVILVSVKVSLVQSYLGRVDNGIRTR